MKEFRLIDCTLRDGSYRLPQGFTAAETARIAQALDEAGLTVVEVGHGLGLGAPARRLAPLGASDTAYLRAARAALPRARMSALAIPGIASLDDLRHAADLGLDVLRVGIDVLRSDEAIPFLAEARALGLEAHASLLKASLVDATDFARRGARMASAGAQYVGLYDSAGTLLPQQVGEMLAAARAAMPAGLAFHGHDNLGLAVANSLAALAAGADTIDATLRGVGRSAGNAATERLLLAARRAGYRVAGDFEALAMAAQEIILPIFGADPGCAEDTAMAFAGLHSDGLTLLRQVAAERRLTPVALALALARHPATARLSRETAEAAAAGLVPAVAEAALS